MRLRSSSPEVTLAADELFAVFAAADDCKMNSHASSHSSSRIGVGAQSTLGRDIFARKYRVGQKK